MSDTARGLSRATMIGAALTALIVLAVGLAVIDSLPVGVFYDDGMYVVLAKSLATGHGLRWLNLPGTPQATHFPPGYPLLLALVWTMIPSFPANVLAFKAMNALLLAVAAGAMVVLAERSFGMPRLAACALALAGCIGIPMLTLSSLVLSEPFFLALLVPALMFAERVTSRSRRLLDLILLGFIAAALTLVRTHGVAFVAAIALALVVRNPARDSLWLRAREAATVVGCAAIALLPWQLWVARHEGAVPEAMRGSYESYAAWLLGGFRTEGPSLAARTVARTSSTTAGLFESMLAPMASPWAHRVALVLLLVLGVIGARRLWRSAPVVAVFLAGYAAIVLLWPFAPARFVWGVWPLVLAVPVLGAFAIATWVPVNGVGHSGRLALLAAGALLLVGYGRYNVHGYRGRWWSSIARAQAASMRPTIAWARARTRPTDVIAANGEPAIYLYSGRQSVPAMEFSVRDYFRPASSAEDAAALREILAAYPVAVIAVSGDSLGVAARQMAASPRPELVLRDRLPNGLVYVPARFSMPQPISQE